MSWNSLSAIRGLFQRPRRLYPERPNTDGPSDWVFVTHQDTKGWILDAICREIGARHPGTWEVAYNPPTLPEGRSYFFSHYSLFMKQAKRKPDLFDSNVLVWYTHPRDEAAFTAQALAETLNSATQTIFSCTSFYELCKGHGLKPEKGRVVLGGADPDLFSGHMRKDGVVGLSSSFYERKNPDTLLALVKQLPHRTFRLVGRNWEKYAHFAELMAQSNFEYVNAPYSDYPGIYRKFDVFLSLAVLEGGPIPLLEAMMSNAVPVASGTGFAPDLIRHGHNGYIFDVGAPAETIAPLIEQAFALKTDVRRTVQDYSWDRFADSILSFGTRGG